MPNKEEGDIITNLSLCYSMINKEPYYLKYKESIEELYRTFSYFS